MSDSSSEIEQVPVSSIESFNHRAILRNLLEGASVIDGYYEVDPKESQVCWLIGYKLEKVNPSVYGVKVLFIPTKTVTKVTLLAPPVVPYVIDKFMPQDLWEVAASGDPSKAPDFESLKCVEMQIEQENAFGQGLRRESVEIYRIDLTKDPPNG